MTLKQVVKRLRKDMVFQRIYAKHKKRHSRHEDTITLEDARKGALLEFYTLKEQIKYEQKPPEHSEREEKPDFYVVINGKSMLNSEWRRLIQEQKRVGDTKVFPSRHPDSYVYVYLKSLFKNDDKPHRDKTVDLWDD